MKIELFRTDRAKDYTGGQLFINGLFECHTLEDPIREVKIKGETAIPEGEYHVTFNMSNRFKKMMPLLLDVPGFAGVRIHAGNTVKDTEGCILCGAWRTRDRLVSSRSATDQLYQKIQVVVSRNEAVTIKIYNHGVF